MFNAQAGLSSISIAVIAEVPQESADVAQEAEERRLRLYSDESMLDDPEQSYKRKMLIDSCIRSFVVVQLAMRYLFAKGFADRRSVGGPEGLGHLHESVFVNVADDDGPSVRPCKGHDVHQSMLAGG